MKLAPLILLVVMLFSCRDKAEIKPAVIHYGEDVCERCKMIISEKNFSTQYLLPRGEARKFDDIGCMIEYLREREDDRDSLIAVYVRDFDTGEWIDGEKAFYFRGGDVQSPMGYGIISFSSEQAMRDYPAFKEGEALGSFGSLTGRKISVQKPSGGEGEEAGEHKH